MRKAHEGFVMTKEQAAKISKSKTGKSNGLNGRFGRDSQRAGIYYMIDESTGEVIRKFYGIREMNRETGFSMTPVKECTQGKRKRAYGYKWIYEKRGKKDVLIR